VSNFFSGLQSSASAFLADQGTKLTETYDKLSSSFGGKKDNTKVVTEAPTIQQLTSSQAIIDANLPLQGGENYNTQAFLESYNRSALANDEVQAILENRTPTVSATQVKQGVRTKGDGTQFFVRLEEKDAGSVVADVVFINTPDVAESRSVDYEAVAPPQYPTAFQKYKGTHSTEWTVNAILISRTTDEATENLRIMNRIRGWTMPYFGQRTANSYPKKLGAPPPVLIFTGWTKNMIGPVPVVMTSANWNFPQDVDYIPAYELSKGDSSTNGTVPFPTVMRVYMQLRETFSTEQVNGFDLAAFRVGDMAEAWKPLTTFAGDSSISGGHFSDVQNGTYGSGSGSVSGGHFSDVQNGTYGGAAEAQTPPRTGFSDVRNGTYDPPRARRGGTIAELRKAAYIAPDPKRVPFKSGGGGDYGGGGATGTDVGPK
jgi:hypothetical protein